MVEFKKQNDEYILYISDNKVIIEPEKVDKKEFLAVIEYLNDAQLFESAEIFYSEDEQEIDDFLSSIKDGVQSKYKLNKEIFSS